MHRRMGASLRVLQECSDGLVCTLGRCTSWQHTAREIWADRVWYTDTRAKVTDLLHAGRVWPPPHVSVAIRDLLFVVANPDYDQQLHIMAAQQATPRGMRKKYRPASRHNSAADASPHHAVRSARPSRGDAGGCIK